MIQPFAMFAMQVELQYMQSGEMYCIYLPMPKLFPSDQLWPAPQKSRKPQELTWIRGPLIGRGSLGRVFKAVEMDGQSNLRRGPWLSYFWGLHWLKDHPIPSMVVFYLKKKSVCSQIDPWTSHRYIVHTKIIPSFIGFISSHHILQWRDLGSLGSPSTPISKDWSNPSSQRGARHLSITEKALHTDQDISRLLLL